MAAGEENCREIIDSIVVYLRCIARANAWQSNLGNLKSLGGNISRAHEHSYYTRFRSNLWMDYLNFERCRIIK